MAMDVKSVIDTRKFSPEKLTKVALFESEKMFCDVYGVAPGQEQKPHVHDDCDKIYFVIEGCGVFKIGGEIREVGEKCVVYAPAGAEHSVKNEGGGNLTLLVLMTPHPNYVSKKA
jgi:mannose-6-phosphate isomerase-like protein (cupin superfamily)